MPGALGVVVERLPAGELSVVGSLSVPSGTNIRHAAAYNAVVYGCGFQNLYVIDAADPAAPVLAGVVAEPEGALCGGLVIDDVAGKLHLSRSTGGLWTYDVSAPLVPVEEGGIDTDLLVAPVATDGALLVTYGSSAALPGGGGLVPPEVGGELLVRDPTTLQTLGEIPLAPAEAVAWLGFVDAGLVVAVAEIATVHLELWDVSDVAAPILLDEAPAWSDGTLHSAHARADRILLSSAQGSAAVFTVEPGPVLRRRRGPTLGVVQRVARRDSDVVVFARDAVRSISLADPAAPAVVAASTPTFPSGLVSFGDARTPPVWLTYGFFLDALTTRLGTSIGTWLDVSFVDVTGTAPTLLGAVETAGPVVEATFAQDHLVVTQEAALETISPPCPPLP